MSIFGSMRIGFIQSDDPTVEFQKNELLSAMINVGLESEQLIINTDQSLTECIEILVAKGCQLIIIPTKEYANELYDIAVNYPDTQFMICGGDRQLVSTNIIHYEIDIKSTGVFRENLLTELENNQITNAENYICYDITYIPIFADVILVLIEFNEINSEPHIWGVERGCIYFPEIEDDESADKVKEIYYEVLDRWNKF